MLSRDEVKLSIYFAAGGLRSIIVSRNDAFEFRDELLKGDISGNHISIRGTINDIEANETELTFDKQGIDTIEIMDLK